ncbi:putative ensconsin-like [Cocos nucifera]|nr:putative ensconsin-like [Cocos nucifera]
MISEPSKRAKTDVSSFAVTIDAVVNVPTTTTAIEVATKTKVMASPTSSSPPVEIQTSEPPIERKNGREKKKKKRSAAAKVRRKASFEGSNSFDGDPEENSFNNREIIRRLIDGYTLPEAMDKIVEADPEQRI